MWHWNLMDDLENFRTPLLHYTKLFVSFQIHWWIQTGVTVRKRSIWVKMGDFFCEIWQMALRNGWAPLLCCYSPEIPNLGQNRLFFSRVTLKFDKWPWKTIGHLSYIASSFGCHFIAISELKLKSQSGNAQFRSKWVTFCSMWPWNLMDDIEKT